MKGLGPADPGELSLADRWYGAVNPRGLARTSLATPHFKPGNRACTHSHAIRRKARQTLRRPGDSAGYPALLALLTPSVE